MRQLLPLLLATALLAACGGEAPKAVQPMAAQEPAVTQVGEYSIRASAVPTASLSEAVLRGYGITGGDDVVLVLVGVRKGPEGQDVSVPAAITGAAIDLQGRRQPLQLRELRSGDLLDYVATVKVDAPDTLRFELQVTAEGAAPATLQFNREFAP